MRDGLGIRDLVLINREFGPVFKVTIWTKMNCTVFGSGGLSGMPGVFGN